MNNKNVERTVTLHFQGEASKRLDKFLVSCMPEYSRSRLQNLIKDGLVNVDGIIAQKSGLLLADGSTIQIQIPPPEPSELQPESIPLDVIFENKDVLVINKAAGMVVHPAAGHSTGTLANAALGYSPEMEGIGGEQRPGIVHRLDKNTSGLILLAKNDHAHQYLQKQFSQRKVEKFYMALVDGQPSTPTGRIEASIGRDPRQRKKMAIVQPRKGRQAISEYRTIESYIEHTLLEVKPITGRTHQIRLHLAYIRCPVVGDTVYGRHHPTIQLERHFLHASRLTIKLPGESTTQTFYAPLPQELEEVLITLQPTG